MISPYHDEGQIAIYQADAIESLGAILAERGVAPAAVVTDPPYGFGHYRTDRAVPIAPVFVAPRVALFGYPETICGWCIELRRAPDEWITWWPTNAAVKAGGRQRDLCRWQEAIAIFGEGLRASAIGVPRSDNRPAVNGEVSETARAGDVWRDPSPGIGFNAPLRLHPNEKPLSLMIRLIELCSAPGDLVVDPFMGSGTTLLACKETGRRAIGIELVERHCETAARRLRQGVLF